MLLCELRRRIPAPCRRAPGESGSGRKSLRGPKDIQDKDRGSEAQRQRTRGKGDDAVYEDAFATELVRQGARRHQRTAEGQHESVGDPVERRRTPSEVASDRWRRYRSAGKTEREHEGGEADRRQDR